MRTHYLFVALALTSACKWTDFDDLEEATWARSTQDPDIGSSDYAVAILGVSMGASGGTLAVVSDDTANFSTIEYSAKGDADIGASPIKLGMNAIGALAEAPVFVTNSMGQIGLVERSIQGGNFAVMFGTATAPVATEFMAAASPAPSPDAAVFAPNGDLVFAAGNTLYSLASTGGTPIACTDMSSMPITVAAMDHDGSNLWVWTKTGSLISFPLAALSPCNGGMLPNPGNSTFTPPGGFMPAPGARLHVVNSTFAILTGHPMTTRSGSIFVVNLSNLTQVGTTATIEGLRTSTVAVLGGDTYLTVGVPDRAIGGVAAGEVDLLAFNTTTGMLDATPALSLHDTDPQSGQLFGRTVTTMNFNGEPIIVVGADSEIFAYYRTTLYDHLP